MTIISSVGPWTWSWQMPGCWLNGPVVMSLLLIQSLSKPFQCLVVISACIHFVVELNQPIIWYHEHLNCKTILGCKNNHRPPFPKSVLLFTIISGQDWTQHLKKWRNITELSHFQFQSSMKYLPPKDCWGTNDGQRWKYKASAQISSGTRGCW